MLIPCLFTFKFFHWQQNEPSTHRHKEKHGETVDGLHDLVEHCLYRVEQRVDGREKDN